MEKTKLILEYIGLDDFSYPTYLDQKGKIWKDINRGKDAPNLYSASGNEPDGEPEYPIRKEYSFTASGPYKRKPHQFEYKLLAGMKADCEFFVGYGRRSAHVLWGKDVSIHITSMKNLWNKLPDDAKPKWLSWDQILEYEAAMGLDPEKRMKGCKALEERGIFIMKEN